MDADGGYDNVLFITRLGTPASNNTVELAQSDSSGSGFNDLLDTQVSSNSSDEIVYNDLARPSKRYVRPEIARGTSTTVDLVVAIQYNGRKLAVDNTRTGEITGEAHVAPIEGTA